MPVTEELIAGVEDLYKEDKKSLMGNGPIFEWRPGNIVLDKQEDKEDFYKLINDLPHHHNDDDDNDYVSENSDGDDDSLGSWESEYSAMDKEEGMIVTDDKISKEGDISDHEYGINESEEEKIDGETELEEGPDDCGDKECADLEEDENSFRKAQRTNINHLRR